MKAQSFREYLMLLLGTLWYGIFIGCIVLFSVLFVPEWNEISTQGHLYYFAIVAFFLFSLIFIHYNYLGERFFGKLRICKDKIKWSCPGYISVSMSYNEMEFIGIGDMDEEYHPPLTIRGDEGTFIYFSKSQIERKFRHKITRLRNKKGFIKYKYSDKLALVLMDVLDAEKQTSIRGFYYQMQNVDKQNQIEKQKRKRKKERLKQKNPAKKNLKK